MFHLALPTAGKRWLSLVAILIVAGGLLSACQPGRDNPLDSLDDFRREITESEEGTVRALVARFDDWLDPDAFGVSLTVMRIAQGVVGFMLLFAGYAIYQFFIILPGLLIGGALGYGLGAEQGGTLLGVVFMVVGAILLGGLVLALHQLAVFLIGAFYGAFFLMVVVDANIIVLIVGGLIGGLLLLALFHLSIVVITAGAGAIMFGGLALGASDTVIVILFVVGMLVQFGAASRQEEDKDGAKEKRDTR